MTSISLSDGAWWAIIFALRSKANADLERATDQHPRLAAQFRAQAEADQALATYIEERY